MRNVLWLMWQDMLIIEYEFRINIPLMSWHHSCQHTNDDKLHFQVLFAIWKLNTHTKKWHNAHFSCSHVIRWAVKWMQGERCNETSLYIHRRQVVRCFHVCNFPSQRIQWWLHKKIRTKERKEKSMRKNLYETNRLLLLVIFYWTFFHWIGTDQRLNWQQIRVQEIRCQLETKQTHMLSIQALNDIIAVIFRSKIYH